MKCKFSLLLICGGTSALTLSSLFSGGSLFSGASLFSGTSLVAKPMGQFYWHLPAIRLNASSGFPSTGSGTGFHITAGESKRPKHQVDIGILFYGLRPAPPVAGARYDYDRQLNIGYLYHWSSNYRSNKVSNNVHFALGRISNRWASSVADIRAEYRGGGWYWRLAFFRAKPNKKNSLLIGVSFMFKYYDRATLTIFRPSLGFTEITPVPVASPSFLNSTDVSFIIGTRY